jgi:hypothetical protein
MFRVNVTIQIARNKIEQFKKKDEKETLLKRIIRNNHT